MLAFVNNTARVPTGDLSHVTRHSLLPQRTFPRVWHVLVLLLLTGELNITSILHASAQAQVLIHRRRGLRTFTVGCEKGSFRGMEEARSSWVPQC